METITRLETYLAALGGEDVSVPDPITRIEMYLKAAVDKQSSNEQDIANIQQEIDNMGEGFTLKGIVETTDDLPETGELGDMYLVSSENYASYIWDGEAWVRKGDDIATTDELLAALYS